MQAGAAFRLGLWALVVAAGGLACRGPSEPLERQSLENAFVAVADAGDVALVKRLLAADASLVHAQARRSFASEPRHALPAAARAGRLEVVRLLLERGVPVGASGYEDSGALQPQALHEAAGQGHADVVALLLERGAAVDAADQYGQTALYQAARRGHADVLALLLARGARADAQDQQGQTPLHAVATSWKLPALFVLCAAGAQRGARDQQGHTPLDLARAQWSEEHRRSDASRDWVAAGATTVAFLESSRCEELHTRALREGLPAPERLELDAFEFGCEHGQAESCSYAGRAWDDAKGVPRDLARARQLFALGCQQGDAWGCSREGWFYLAGQGVPKDEARGARLYEQACEGGHAFACGRLGEFYVQARGVPRDLGRARELLKRACESRHKDEQACLTLARLAPEARR